MKIAVTYENGQVFQHFGHCEQFKLYDAADGAVTSSQVVSAVGSGHGALAGFLQSHGVDALICGGIGAGARGTLSYDPDTQCAHHHEEGHQCRSGSCGEDKHGCSGNQ